MTTATHWRAIDDYGEVCARAKQAYGLDCRAFLDGPIARLVEMASDETMSARARARIMEHARAAWSDYAAFHRGDADEAGARAFVLDRVRGTPDERVYMMEVWDGFSNHNYRYDPDELEDQSDLTPAADPAMVKRMDAASPLSPAMSPAILPADWRDFYALTKPRVMSLVIFTGLCGLLAAPGSIHPVLGFTAILCIALGAGGAAALNQWWEADLDAGMKRTAARPLPAGRLQRNDARDFGIALSVGSVGIMGLAVGWLAAGILAVSIIYYAVVYTIWLKPRTPQNIVIGGGAGAFPPMIGWVAVTGDVTLMPVLLFAIIFMWTPPHFWALALFVQSDYAKVGIPMMPVVKGERSTRRQILVYAVLLLPVAIAPWLIGGTGAIYGVAALALSLAFVALSLSVAMRQTGPDDRMRQEKRLFGFSIVYLFALFGALVADRVLTHYGFPA